MDEPPSSPPNPYNIRTTPSLPGNSRDDSAIPNTSLPYTPQSDPPKRTPTRPHTSSTELEYYDMTNPRRGVAAVFNQQWLGGGGVVERDGNQTDVQQITHAFTMLGFEIKIYIDLTLQMLERTLENLRALDHSDRDCFALIFLTYGKEGKLRCSDGEIDLNLLWMNFTAERCTSLVNKPKLFFVVSCLGCFRHKAANSPELVQMVPSDWLPDEADFLIAFSTVPGFCDLQTCQHRDDGSQYIQFLCNYLRRYGFRDDLLTILTNVARRVDNGDGFFEEAKGRYNTQKPSFISFLTRPLRFTNKKRIRPSTKDECYDMTNPRRGVAAVFSQQWVGGGAGGVVERDGNQSDVQLIETTFSKLGFKVEIYIDHTLEMLEMTLDYLSIRDHSDSDCFALIFLTYGKEGKLRCSGGEFDLNLLWMNFTAEQCPSLVNKPKLFFIVSCLGCYSHKAANSPELVQMVPSDSLPDEADFLIAFSTVPGFCDWQTWNKGNTGRNNEEKASQYIVVLCDYLTRFSLNNDLLTILTMVARRIGDGVKFFDKRYQRHLTQQPSFISYLTRSLRFPEKYVAGENEGITMDGDDVSGRE